MLQGELKNGFKYEIDPQNLDDYEVLELISNVDANPLLMPRLITTILGEEQKNRLVQHLKEISETGKVTIDAMGVAFTEIMTQSKETKN